MKKLKLLTYFLFGLAGVFLIGYCALLSPPAFAKKEYTEKDLKRETESFFSISPPSFDLSCHGGEKKTISIKIENPHPQPIQASLYPIGLAPTGGSDLVNKPISSLPPTDLSRHIIVESPSVIIPPKSYKQVSVAFDVPEGLSGTQYVGLTAANTSQEAVFAEFGTGIERESEYEIKLDVGMQPAIGITVKCHMEGTLKYSYSLTKLKVVGAQGNELPKIIASIKNTGNAEITLFPIMVLLDSQQRVVSRLKASSRETLIPIAVKDIEFSSKFKDIPSGSYKAVISAADPKYQLPPLEKNVVVP